MTVKEFKFQYALGTISKEDLIKIAKKSTSKYILTVLSKNKDWYIRSYVATNSSTPIDALIKLSKDEDWFVRSRVTENPSVVEALSYEDSFISWEVDNQITSKMV